MEDFQLIWYYNGGSLFNVKYLEKTIGSLLLQCKYLWTKQSSWN